MASQLSEQCEAESRMQAMSWMKEQEREEELVAWPEVDEPLLATRETVTVLQN